MYWKDTYEFLNSNDIEYKWEGKYGAKGEKRQKKKKATPEQMKKQNQWKKREKYGERSGGISTKVISGRH